MRLRITKTKMNDILSTFKRILSLSDKFTIINDCIYPHHVVNGVHIIRQAIADINDNSAYTTTDSIADILKQISELTGLSKIEFLWNDDYIGFETDDTIYVLLQKDSEYRKPNYHNFNEILNQYNDWYVANIDDIRRIKDSKVAILGGVRISKNLLPCITSTRKNAPPNFSIEYSCRPDNVIILHVKYSKLEAIHAYSYSPIPF